MVDPLTYFSFQPVLHNWCNKGRGMCYPVWDDAYKRTHARRKCFIKRCTQHFLFTVIWRQTYGKGLLRWREGGGGVGSSSGDGIMLNL